MTVRENLAFALTRVLKIKDEADIEKRSKESLEAVGLTEAIDKMPSDLSGGMRKRMALARTIIVNPKLFCMMNLQQDWIPSRQKKSVT
jgi:phospholipid/cholesterol/gamma-HCH transport system ATP-binding protein